MIQHRPNWQSLRKPIMPIAADTTLLLAASSFIKRANHHQDPRADRAFDAVSTAYCNGAPLFLPLPKKSAEEIPIFLDLWQKAGLTPVPDLELSDSEFTQAMNTLQSSISDFLNGMPYEAARWIQFQFMPQIVGNHLRRSDATAIRRAGPTANILIRNGSVDELKEALHELQRQENFREPPDYTRLIGHTDIRSVIHLSVAYAISVCVRGYSYALNLGALKAQPAYRHHWIRIPAVSQSKLLSKLKGSEQPSWFPWGAILTKVFDPQCPLTVRNRDKVAEVLQALRSSSDQFRRQLASSTASRGRKAVGPKITDEEVFILDTLANAGVFPRYRNSNRPEKLATWLRHLVGSYAKVMKVPVEWLTSNLQPEWARKMESNKRIAFRRDTFWDIFADPGIRSALDSNAGST